MHWASGRESSAIFAVMSSNGETNVVLRGVTHGAVDFLIKPVRIEELRNVWQHVVRRKRDQVRTKSFCKPEHAALYATAASSCPS